MVTLCCAVVGAAGSAFAVDIDENKWVDHLKDAIKAKKMYQFPADELRLFLAKTADGAWLSSRSEDIEKLEKGEKTALIEALTEEKLKLPAADSLKDILEENHMTTPESRQVHVLVVVPTEQLVIKINDFQKDENVLLELKHYQQRGLLIQDNCQDYCAQFLKKIDELYAKEYRSSAPFICVEGSSGMGKSQLAFALGGKRPWYYWPVTKSWDFPQKLYHNFSSLSSAFHSAVKKDDPSNEKNVNYLNTTSDVYQVEELWTYGFICKLLLHSMSEKHQSARQLIRFDSEITFNVERCNVETVREVIAKMKKENKMLPFFILDEMNVRVKAEDTTAFQRNVFRACGLVVIIMGTDSKISNLVGQASESYGDPHNWMMLVPRFPSYQMMLNTSEEERTWTNLVNTYSALNDIVTHSRGRFARLFQERVVQYSIQSNENQIELINLLDEGFGNVSLKTHEGKAFLNSIGGKFAQVMAISHINVDEPAQKKRRLDVAAFGMHLHFANLIDDKFTDITVCQGHLATKFSPWVPKCCFPAIDEDVLLYLAILGGKDFPGYYDRQSNTHYSTKRIFAEIQMPLHENLNAVSKDYKSFENMVAHAIFSSSRRNGVKGITFSDFFACLLGEFQDKLWKKIEMNMTANDLFEGYEQSVLEVLNATVPFLAPPNAEWPPFIIDNNRYGCRFGHLVRAKNSDRCDVYVQDITNNKLILLCECKHWKNDVGMSTLEGIISGLNVKWKWNVALLFCPQLADFYTKWKNKDVKCNWKNKDVGCVKVSCSDGGVDCVFQPVLRNRKRLFIVIETGEIHAGDTPA